MFDHIFISEVVGVEKPNMGYFDAVFTGAKITEPEKALIIGDSLTSDIKGGNNAGIKTCWYNPRHEVNNKGVTVDYEIDDLNRIFGVLEE